MAPKPASPPPAPVAPVSPPVPAHPGGYRIESYSKTHEGRVRTHNEDSHVARDDGGLWAVADGMGGHEGGEWASGRIVRELGRIDLALGFEDTCEEAAQAVHAANKQILAEGKKRGKSMGSTLVMLVIEGSRYAVLWAGDSRAYLMRNGTLERLSRDHTQVQEMVARGLMTPEQAQGHPMGHVLSRAVGVQKEVEIDRADGEIQPGDIFLLCSDGLHGVVGEEAIAAHFAREAPDQALDTLIDLTLEKGAPDNVTGIAIWISEPTLLSFAEAKP
ncbi:MAG TPA: PP2C family serine/threonine-protein phosphatase [Allosphingosinicella sp.]|nr:PP2C family serine/threonine-protein phosphatase [Allosphingosinicella sp.]